jgi:hypothetical protein
VSLSLEGADSSSTAAGVSATGAGVGPDETAHAKSIRQAIAIATNPNVWLSIVFSYSKIGIALFIHLSCCGDEQFFLNHIICIRQQITKTAHRETCVRLHCNIEHIDDSGFGFEV